MTIPACISIQRYDSISGEELNPYRRLSAGDIQTIVGGKQRYRALIHKRIPIHAVGVEILPAYYEDFLKKQYPDLYFDLPAAFQSVDQATDFPAMSRLLFEIEATARRAARRCRAGRRASQKSAAAIRRGNRSRSDPDRRVFYASSFASPPEAVLKCGKPARLSSLDATYSLFSAEANARASSALSTLVRYS